MNFTCKASNDSVEQACILEIVEMVVFHSPFLFEYFYVTWRWSELSNESLHCKVEYELHGEQ